jgi:quinoprotein glucose dehydrogenase
MMQRRTKRFVGFALVAGAAVIGATFTRVAPTVAQQGKPLVRGNAYGEWRHWGAGRGSRAPA